MSKVYLADTYQEFDQWCRDKNTPSGNKTVLVTRSPNILERMMGLEIKPDDLHVIGDPQLKYSEWMTLQTRIRK